MRHLLVLAFAVSMAPAQTSPENYDESKVGTYTLPDPLVMENGGRVRDAQTWLKRRRPEIFQLFESHVYGRVVEPPERPRFEVLSVDRGALGGAAVRKQVRCWFAGKDGPKMDILIYL